MVSMCLFKILVLKCHWGLLISNLAYLFFGTKYSCMPAFDIQTRSMRRRSTKKHQQSTENSTLKYLNERSKRLIKENASNLELGKQNCGHYYYFSSILLELGDTMKVYVQFQIVLFCRNQLEQISSICIYFIFYLNCICRSQKHGNFLSCFY